MPLKFPFHSVIHTCTVLLGVQAHTGIRALERPAQLTIQVNSSGAQGEVTEPHFKQLRQNEWP